jgi:hypothetical protein
MTMKAVVVYESMYGNTHLVADAIGEGLRDADSMVEVTVVPVERATEAVRMGADLLVVGGPTHVHTMSSDRSRHAALDAAAKPDSTLELDPDAEGPGLRDWFDGTPELALPAAAFDTRIDAPAFLTGRASKGIAKRLRRHGCTLVAEPESFLVTKDNHLIDDESEHAQEWGRRLAAAAMTSEVSRGPT